jgi:hypothetical protein
MLPAAPVKAGVGRLPKPVPTRTGQQQVVLHLPEIEKVSLSLETRPQETQCVVKRLYRIAGGSMTKKHQ